MRGEEGFSLIEMLVALAVMALVTGLVIFTGPASGGSLAAETDRFIVSLATARDLALIESRVVTVEVSETGHLTTVHSRLVPGTQPAAPESWSKGTTVATSDGRLPALVTFDPVGLTEPATFTLYRDGAMQRVAIDPSGEIRRVSDDG
jgi:general secretion pathway protein H